MKVNALNAPVKEQEFSEKKRNVVEVINPSGSGPFVLVCEHASNFIPEEYKKLGLGKKALASHIAWDPGALEIATNLSKMLDAPLVASNISRLIYDCNRPPTVKSAVAERSENFDIKGNINLGKDQLDERAEKYYFPFRNALSECLGFHTRRVGSSIMVTIHTFTPVYQGRARTIELGVLHDRDSRMADGLLKALADAGVNKVARNQPYGPRDGVTHTLKEHGSKRGIANVMIEIRNDLVKTDEQKSEISNMLSAGIVSAANNLNTRLG